ncbi:MAG: SpvB/TcaC N-terminal domain-containing protein, partial [Deltaproteobacteria bacterium]|nr:SpvB/TcaC N-terminal domain-containing protein [Deltaproteobacteria bacterium]
MQSWGIVLGTTVGTRVGLASRRAPSVAKSLVHTLAMLGLLGGCAGASTGDLPAVADAGTQDAPADVARGRQAPPIPPRPPQGTTTRGATPSQEPSSVVRRGQWSTEDRLLSGEVLADSQTLAATPERSRISAPDRARDARAGVFSVRVQSEPTQWARAWLVYELTDGSHWSAVRRRINDGSEQGGFHSSRTATGGTQVEEISPWWLTQGVNTVRFEPRDATDPTGYSVASVRIVALRAAPASPEPLAAPLEAHGGAFGRWTDGEPSTAVTGAETDAAGREATWSWRERVHVRALDVLTRGTGVGHVELSWTSSDGLARMRRALDVPANSQVGRSESLTISPAIEASDLRITMLPRREHEGLAIAEVAVLAESVPRTSRARLALTWPAHGECVDREAYIRGFAVGAEGRPAAADTELWLDGRQAMAQSNADGSFGLLLQANPQAPSEHWVEARFADGTTERQRFVLGRCVPREPPHVDAPREDLGAPFSGWARAHTASTLTLGDAVVEIPAGAVARDTRITLRPLAAAQVPALNRGMVNTSPEGRAYRFGPDGLRFAKPIRLSLPFAQARLSPGSTAADAKTFFYDVGARQWREVSRVASGSADRLAAATNHFTDYITATITSPDSPQSTAFDANTIQGLQAANPAAGVQFIAAPTANASGSANVALPVLVPPGRQGLQPSVGLAYDSARGNGWLGVGWDLGVSRVEVDTRNGVPEYTPSSEETYLLDGAQLVAVDPPGANPRRYARRVESALDLIYRHGASKSDYWWDVRTRDGGRFVYGRRPALVAMGVEDTGRLSEGAGQPTGRWMLEESRDENNNAVVYHYDVTRTVIDTRYTTRVVEQRLREIEYTVKYPSFDATVPSLGGRYFVHFVTESGRTDVQTSGRLGFLEQTSGRLASIQVDGVGPGTRIRRYTLVYTIGDFGKSLLQSVVVAGAEGTADLYTHTFDYGQAARFGGRVGFSQPELYAHMPSTPRAGYSRGVGTNLHVGVGDTAHIINVGAGFGGSYTNSRAESERLDVNGDGLPDLLSFTLLPQVRGALPANRFVGSLSAIGHTLLGENESSSGQLNIGLQLFDMGAGGVDGAFGFSRTVRTLADVNGDGFVDLVTGPHRETVSGVSANVLRVYENPTPYNRTSFGVGAVGPTPDYTIGGVVVQAPSVEIPSDALAEAITQSNALTAPLVAWRVIRPGSVRITGAIDHPDTQGDGVHVEIYRVSGPLGSNTVQMPIWSKTILPTDPPCTPAPGGCGTGLDLNNLNRDDRLYFVVRPGATGTATAQGDRVNWSPRITYTAVEQTDQCTDQELGCPWPASEESVSVGTYFDRSEDFRVADRDLTGWTSIRRGVVSIDSAPVILSTGDTVNVRIWVRRVVRTSTGLPPEADSSPPYDAGAADASADAAPPPVMTPAEIDAALMSLTVQLLPVTASVTIPAGGGPGPSVVDFETFQGDQFFFSVALPSDKLDPALVRWEPLIHYTKWCGRDASGTQVCPLLTDCGTPAGQGMDGSPGCRWQNPTPLGPDPTQWVPLSIVQQTRPMLAVSVSDSPSTRPAPFPGAGPFPIHHRRVDLTMGWYRRWGVGEWRADVAGLIERNLIDPMWTATAPMIDTPGGLSGEPIASRRSPVFVGMAPQRLPLDASIESTATRGHYGVPAGVTLVEGSAEEAQWVGSGRVSAVNHWSLIPSRRGGFRIEGSGPTRRAVPDGDWTTSASEGASLRSSNGPTGGFNITLMGVGFGPNYGQSTTTLDFFDVNGDRRPDSVQSNGIVRLQLPRAPGATHTTLTPDRSMPGMADVVRRSVDFGLRHSFSIGSAAGAVRRALKETGALSGRMSKDLNFLGYMPSFGVTDGRTGDVIDWVDVNGDGLPDQLTADGDTMKVRYNLGTRFSPEMPLIFTDGVGKDDPEEAEFDAINVTTSHSISSEFGYLGSGGGASWNYSYGQTRFIDMNGDGLPDRVWARNPVLRDGRLRVRFNLGSHFGPAQDWNAPSWNTTGHSVSATDDALSFSWSSGVKATAGGVIQIPILPFWDLSLVPSAGGNFGAQSHAGRISLEDINGDGLVDHVMTPNTNGLVNPSSNRIFARINRTGGANLLRRVTGPFGARVDLEYELVGNRVETVGAERIDMPGARYVLSRVRSPATSQETPEGPNPEYITNFSYGGGFYDRIERQDYGFSRVTVCDTQLTCSDTFYNNQSYLLRGTVSAASVRDSLGRRTTASQTVYEASTVGMPPGVTHVRTKIQRQFIYDGVTPNVTTPSLTTETEQFYDGTGRLQSIVDRGEPGDSDDLHANIVGYFVASAPFNIQRPQVVELRDHGGALLRRREASFGASGQLTAMTDRLTGGIDPEVALTTPPSVHANRAVTTTFTYDSYGNVATVTDPSGFVLTYGYDASFTHRTNISDSFGLSSSAEYDARFGAVNHSTDSNGHHVYYHFDGYGRATAVFGPNDNPLTSTPTISYEYQLAPGVTGFPRAWAVTRHKDVGRTTTIDTVTFIDRTLRVIQTKKTSELEAGSGTTTTPGWVISGPIAYDALGRPWREWRGGFDANADPTHLVPLVRTLSDPHSETTYDGFGRARIARAPDGTQVLTDYTVEAIPGETALRLRTRLTDPMLRHSDTYARANGAVVEMRHYNTVAGVPTTLRTRYSYDVQGRLAQVLDANNNPTTATYDSLGHMISLNNRDSGLIEYHYSAAGDLGA